VQQGIIIYCYVTISSIHIDNKMLAKLLFVMFDSHIKFLQSKPCSTFTLVNFLFDIFRHISATNTVGIISVAIIGGYGHFWD
jgi:hypothetical protein